MPDVNMPKLSDTMEEGTVLDWKKQDGDEVRRGEVLAEIESDKASFEIEAEADGVLRIVVDRGQAVPVGQMIGRIGGEAPARQPAGAPAETGTAAEPATGAEGPADAAPAPAEPAPAAEEPARATEEPAEAPEPEAQPAPRRPAAAAAAPEAATSRAGGNGADRTKASPLARRLAGELGVDLASVEGSGPEGRIVKEDVLAAAERSGHRAPAAPATAPRPRPAGPDV